MKKNTQVYYDPETTALFTVKGETKHRVIIGGVSARFLNDARTSYTRYSISKAVFKRCVPIDESSALVVKDEYISCYRICRGYLRDDPSEFRFLRKLTSKIIEYHKDGN